MGSIGDCFDNAMYESFFATLECELLNRQSFKTYVEPRLALFDFIEGCIAAIPHSTTLADQLRREPSLRLISAAQPRQPKRVKSSRTR
jgi:hypothetical protein